MKLPFFTIGHSNRSIEAFVDLLREQQVELLADIRKFPMSRANPQFNENTLRDSLHAFQIAYEHIAALGGLRSKARTLDIVINGFWANKSFHNYADYALSDSFHAGLRHLIEVGHERRTAIMCSEAVWWRCHRRIVADYLIASGQIVFHIMGPDRIEPARLTTGAIVQSNGNILYPPSQEVET